MQLNNCIKQHKVLNTKMLSYKCLYCITTHFYIEWLEKCTLSIRTITGKHHVTSGLYLPLVLSLKNDLTKYLLVNSNSQILNKNNMSKIKTRGRYNEMFMGIDLFYMEKFKNVI